MMCQASSSKLKTSGMKSRRWRLNGWFSTFDGICPKLRRIKEAIHPPGFLMDPLTRAEPQAKRQNLGMRDSDKAAIAPAPADGDKRLEEAINNLSLGIVVFNARREVVF